jgi:hypothetical protein
MPAQGGAPSTSAAPAAAQRAVLPSLEPNEAPHSPAFSRKVITPARLAPNKSVLSDRLYRRD